MTTHEERQKSEVEGMRQMLGLTPFTTTPIEVVVCEHESDGFVYEKNEVFRTLMCTKCGVHYDERI